MLQIMYASITAITARKHLYEKNNVAVWVFQNLSNREWAQVVKLSAGGADQDAHAILGEMWGF